jgi:hypothetical protein
VYVSNNIPVVSNEEKKAVWDAYHQGKPKRVPVLVATNPRVILLNPRLNTGRYSFERYFQDPGTMLEVQLQHAHHRATWLHRFTDDPLGVPEVWHVSVDRQNVYEAAFFGAPLVYREGQVPDTKPILDAGDRERIFLVDIEHPLEHGFFHDALQLCLRMKELARRMEYQGHPVEVLNYAPSGTDGPLTVGTSLRGQAIFVDLMADPDYATCLLGFITQAASNRVWAVRRYWQDENIAAGLADDSVQLISTCLYRDMVMPHHRRFYDTFMPDRPRSIHLCGDSTRHFRTMRDELNIRSFDTGFPVDFAWLRYELGPDVEILGGPPVSLLLHGSPEMVYQKTREILLSGVKEGGRFILREGNNLPPLVPEENLAAMYRCCLEHGWY